MLLSYPRHPGHVARVSPAGSPLPHLPSPDLSRLLCHLRPDCSVRAGQCGRGRSDEAPGGQQQGGAAGGDGGRGREEGERGGQPTPQHGFCGRRPGAKFGHTCAGDQQSSHYCMSERAWSGGDNDDDSGDDLMWQVQVEDEECSHGNLLSMGRMLSLPSDNYVHPLRCSPCPPIGHEAYCGYSYSGNLVVYSQLNERTIFTVL